MHGWTGGYVADLEYNSDYHTQLSPYHLHACALLNGWEPAPLPEDFTYCELGCGVGHTIAVLAAANPGGSFWGVDFLPGHIVAARAVAEAGGLGNLRLLEASFAELADAAAPALPPCDVIALHGVYSWVSPENRRAIVRVLARYLKTGGVAYVSYNALPGTVLGQPMQRLLRALAGTRQGRSDDRFRRAFALVDRLADAGAVMIRDNPTFKLVKRQVAEDRLGYLTHEYINDHWHPLYFADVAAELAEAKLGYVGSADPLHAFRDLSVTREQAAVLDEIDDPTLKETVRDFCFVDNFRRDVFARGARRLSGERQAARLRDCRLALTVPPRRVVHGVKVPIGEATMNEAAYQPMFAALAEGTMSVGGLLDLAPVRAASCLHPGEVLGMIVGSSQAAVAPPADRLTDRATVAGLNRAIADGSLVNGQTLHEAFAAPTLGGGLSTDLVERLLYLALATGVAAAPEPLADFIIPPVLAHGHRFSRDDVPIEDEAERRAHVAERMREFLAERLPLWQRVGIM